MNAQTQQNLTKNQSLVMNALSNAHQPLQVYRALEKLVEYGLVHRLESLNAFVACTHTQAECCSSHHGTVAFAICESCGQVTEFHDHEIDHRLERWVKDSKFKAEKTTIEIRGLCAACSA